jgi:hypothetical protein
MRWRGRDGTELLRQRDTHKRDIRHNDLRQRDVHKRDLRQGDLRQRDLRQEGYGSVCARVC